MRRVHWCGDQQSLRNRRLRNQSKKQQGWLIKPLLKSPSGPAHNRPLCNHRNGEGEDSEALDTAEPRWPRPEIGLSLEQAQRNPRLVVRQEEHCGADGRFIESQELQAPLVVGGEGRCLPGHRHIPMRHALRRNRQACLGTRRTSHHQPAADSLRRPMPAPPLRQPADHHRKAREGARHKDSQTNLHFEPLLMAQMMQAY